MPVIMDNVVRNHSQLLPADGPPLSHANKLEDYTLRMVDHKRGGMSEYEKNQIQDSLARLARFESKLLNERESTDLVEQCHKNACIAAVGQMLTNGAVSQHKLVEEFVQYRHPQMRKPEQTASLEWLPGEIGPDWEFSKCRRDNPASLDILLRTGSSWAAEFRATGADGHVVVVDGLNALGNIEIRDPLRNRK